MRALAALALIALTLPAAHAGKVARTASYPRLGQALLHGAAEAVLKRRELVTWYKDRAGSASKSKVMGSLRIEGVSKKGNLYQAAIHTRAEGQDGEPQISTKVGVRRLSSGKYQVKTARVTWVNDIWE